MDNKSLTALCIDNYGVESRVLTACLKSFGVDVIEADNGFDAASILQSGCRFNMITINMDESFGEKTTRCLREMGVVAKLVGFTCQEREMIPKFMSAGLDFCLEKPPTFHKVAEVITQLDQD